MITLQLLSTVTVTLLLQLVVLSVNVKITFPEFTEEAVTVPSLATVAIDVLLLLQVPPEDDDNICALLPRQI